MAPWPAHLGLRREGADLVLERRWLTPRGIGLVVLWELGTLGLVLAVAQGLGGSPLRWVLFAALAIGTYLALTVAANRTRIRAGAGRLAVSHGPFPLPGWGPWGRCFSRAQMAQFAVRADLARRRAELRLRLVDGAEITLEVFTSPDHALYVEGLLRAQLSGEGAPEPRHRERGVGMIFTAGYVCLLASMLRHFIGA